ncbi:MAG TPA: hypothetical protein VK633_10905, partial [Verrucomicrobiae bacterium]|nr:hypothetical protein [Verrucomicrobiae bacterium]
RDHPGTEAFLTPLVGAIQLNDLAATAMDAYLRNPVPVPLQLYFNLSRMGRERLCFGRPGAERG